MKKVKVYGAGSIGNHLAQASRRMGWRVDICDIDEDALKRTKNEIYPSRYGTWDDQISLYSNDTAPVGGYDLIVIGTPPDSHMNLARSAVREGAKAVLVEKPLCTPDLNGAQELFNEAKKANCLVFVGYDHAISKSALKMSESLKSQHMGKINTLDVEFREYWGGIFQAHPWLDGPADSYLGYLQKGGGACGEHSHAINLFQSFAHEANIGRVVEVSSIMDYVNDGILDYDSVCLMNLRTEKDIIGRVVQDVITKPTRKWARAQCENGYLEWCCGDKPGFDSVIYGKDSADVENLNIQKTRPDDFFQELQHISSVLDNNELYNESPIRLERGLETMLVISAAHLSSKNNCTVKIDFSKGFTIEALSF
jgi:predicted dehydrogenase